MKLVWLMLWSVFLVVGCGGSSSSEDTPPAADSDSVLLDVRTPGEYASGHMPGAIHIPIYNLAARIDELAAYKNTHVTVYCESGGRSAEGVKILLANGFTNVVNDEGGMQAYRKAH